MSAAVKYANSYDYQRAMFWARKMRTLTEDELQKLIDQNHPEEEILKKAKEINAQSIR